VESIKCSNYDRRPNIQITKNVIAQLCIPKDGKRLINELISFNYENSKTIEDRECGPGPSHRQALVCDAAVSSILPSIGPRSR